MRVVVSFAVLLALGGCGQADNQPGPGGVTVGEARALDEAAEMIDAGRPTGAPQPSASAGPAR